MPFGSTTSAPREALELTESVSLLEEAASLPADFFTPEPGSVFDAQGRVPVIVIRPGLGKGRGRHLYEAKMLRENAHKFSGWRQFVDHLSPEARKAAGGLPRSVRDLGGRLQETMWWDDLPATAEHDQGGVIGLSKPVPWIRDLIESDPEIVESSISASATNVRPVTHGGVRAWLVEGIEDKGTLDWVTEAGAGGRVIPLMEAAYQTQEAVDMALLEAMDDDEFRTYLDEQRPALVEAMTKGTPAPEPGGATDDDPEGGNMAEISRDTLQEALSEHPDVLVEALQQSAELQLFVNGLVEAKLDTEREALEQQAEDKTQRVIDLHRFRDAAHGLIAESKLPESWQEGLRSKYSLQEGKPSDALDVLDEVDGEGNVVKSAEATLREAVDEDIKAEAARLAEANPTRVRRQGPKAEADAPASGGGAPQKRSSKNTGWGRFLQESAGVDPDEAFALNGAGGDE